MRHPTNPTFENMFGCGGVIDIDEGNHGDDDDDTGAGEGGDKYNGNCLRLY